MSYKNAEKADPISTLEGRYLPATWYLWYEKIFLLDTCECKAYLCKNMHALEYLRTSSGLSAKAREDYLLRQEKRKAEGGGGKDYLEAGLARLFSSAE